MTRAFEDVVAAVAAVRAALRRDDLELPAGLGVAVVLEPYTWADFASDPRVPAHVQPNGSIVVHGVPVVCGKP